jgi:hypothetical protein
VREEIHDGRIGDFTNNMEDIEGQVQASKILLQWSES